MNPKSIAGLLLKDSFEKGNTIKIPSLGIEISKDKGAIQKRLKTPLQSNSLSEKLKR